MGDWGPGHLSRGDNGNVRVRHTSRPDVRTAKMRQMGKGNGKYKTQNLRE